MNINYKEFIKDWDNKKKKLSANTIKEVFNLWYDDKLTKKEKKNVDQYKKKLRKFILSDKTLINIIEEDNKKRYHLHNFCNKIGLDHESSGIGKNRTICIKKNKKWKWGVENTQIHYNNKVNSKRKNKLSKIYCDYCGTNGSKIDLFAHYSGIGPICEDCLDIETTDNGTPFSAYKFEYIGCIL